MCNRQYVHSVWPHTINVAKIDFVTGGWCEMRGFQLGWGGGESSEEVWRPASS